MRKIIRLTESDLVRVIKKILNEQDSTSSVTKSLLKKFPFPLNLYFRDDLNETPIQVQVSSIERDPSRQTLFKIKTQPEEIDVTNQKGLQDYLHPNLIGTNLKLNNFQVDCNDTNNNIRSSLKSNGKSYRDMIFSNDNFYIDFREQYCARSQYGRSLVPAASGGYSQNNTTNRVSNLG